MNPTLPNFLMVGAAKSGTTSIYQHLREHPNVFMPDDKEPNFFVRSVRTAVENQGQISTLEDYLALYRDAEGFAARGDACVHNLYYHKVAIPEIQKHLGDVKIIIALRNPVDRAWSQYSSMTANRRFDSFEAYLEFEDGYTFDAPTSPLWADRNCLYRSWSSYYEQVKAYLDNFSNVEIVLFEDLRHDPSGTMRRLYRFLEVDDGFSPDVNKSYNVSVTPRNPFVGALINLYTRLRIGGLITAVVSRLSSPERALQFKAGLFATMAPFVSKKVTMRPDTRSRLKEGFRSDIEALQTLIKRDLTTWL